MDSRVDRWIDSHSRKSVSLSPSPSLSFEFFSSKAVLLVRFGLVWSVALTQVDLADGFGVSSKLQPTLSFHLQHSSAKGTV